MRYLILIGILLLLTSPTFAQDYEARDKIPDQLKEIEGSSPWGYNHQGRHENQDNYYVTAHGWWAQIRGHHSDPNVIYGYDSRGNFLWTREINEFIYVPRVGDRDSYLDELKSSAWRCFANNKSSRVCNRFVRQIIYERNKND
jgi:hypothetical protein